MIISAFNSDDLTLNIDGFCRVLIDSVHAGGAIGFLAPLSNSDAREFWMGSIHPEVQAKRRILLAAMSEEGLAGTVQILSRLQPNQPHRCEIAKMMVHPSQRRKGVGRALMLAALDRANRLGKTLITLDTRTGDAAQSLYRSVGFEEMGIVPNFALNPDGKAFHSTTYMYRQTQ